MQGCDQELLREMSGFIARHMGLHFPEDRFADLARGLGTAGRELGFQCPQTFCHWLRTQEPSTRQLETLAGHLTVGETYFLRDPASFELLENELLPALVADRTRAGGNLRLWSAGCSSGEEAYSLAIACARTMPALSNWRVSILATDINPKALAKAEAGVYSEWSFRGAPTWLRERFFTPGPDKKLAVSSRIKKLVQFGYLNLVADKYPSLHNRTNGMDVIFCRNVLMYLTPEHQRRVVEGLHASLVEGGCLLVNPAEASHALFPMFEMENTGGVILFRKDGRSSISASRREYGTPRPVEAVPDFVSVAAFLPGGPDIPDIPDIPVVPAEAPVTAQPATATTPAPAPTPASAPSAELPAESTRAEGVPEPGDLLARARSHANEGRLEEALAACQRALAASPTDLTARFLYATICHELDRIDEAVAGLGRVLYLDQDFVLAHHALGGLYRRLGKERESRRHLAIALELLATKSKDEIVPESDGMTCGRLQESARVMIGA